MRNSATRIVMPNITGVQAAQLSKSAGILWADGASWRTRSRQSKDAPSGIPNTAGVEAGRFHCQRTQTAKACRARPPAEASTPIPVSPHATLDRPGSAPARGPRAHCLPGRAGPAAGNRGSAPAIPFCRTGHSTHRPRPPDGRHAALRAYPAGVGHRPARQRQLRAGIAERRSTPWSVQDALGRFHPSRDRVDGQRGRPDLHLHPARDVTFHDGTPFNATAVVRNLERIATPPPSRRKPCSCSARSSARRRWMTSPCAWCRRTVRALLDGLEPGLSRHGLARRA